MQHAKSLPPRTLAVLERLSSRSDLAGFTLIGGTALALQQGHRMSEDLDLAWTDGELPLQVVRKIIQELPQENPAIDLIDPVEKDLADDAGMYLAAHQQDWKIDGVKVTFFTPKQRAADIINEGSKIRIGNLDVATEDTLFALKSVVLLDRTASRDLFDLWWFYNHYNKSPAETLKIMRQHDPHLSVDMHLDKIAPKRLPMTDPGFETSIPDAPQTSEELLSRMAEYAASEKRKIARNIALQAHRRGPQI